MFLIMLEKVELWFTLKSQFINFLKKYISLKKSTLPSSYFRNNLKGY